MFLAGYEAKARRQEPFHVLLLNEKKQLSRFPAGSTGPRSLVVCLREPKWSLASYQERNNECLPDTHMSYFPRSTKR